MSDDQKISAKSLGNAFAELTHQSSTNMWLWFILAWVLHLFNVMRGNFLWSPNDPIFFVYIMFALILSFTIYRKEDDRLIFRSLGWCLAVSVAAYYAPVVVGLLLNKGILTTQIGRLILIFLPVWPIVMFFGTKADKPTRVMGMPIVIAWVIYCLFAVALPQISQAPGATVLLPTPQELWDSASSALLDIKTNTVDKAVDAYNRTCIQCFVNGSIESATTPYYTGTVDSSQGQNLGVYITNTQPLFSKFDASTDDVVVTATLQANTLTDQGIDITNDCSLTVQTGGTTTPLSGKVDRPNLHIDYTGAFQQSNDIDCSIDQSKVASIVTPGRSYSGLVQFNSTFNFDTWGYVQNGFMERDLLVSLRRTNVDAANEIGIDSHPVSKYTPGPVQLGMPSDTQPYSFDSSVNSNQLPAFGVTLSNAWFGKGTLVKINQLSFYIPKQFVLDTTNCAPRVVAQMGEWGENPAYNEYNITGDIKTDAVSQNFVTVRCPLKLGSDSKYPILGPSGAGIYTFYVDTKYTYSVNTQSSVYIQNTGSSAASTNTGTSSTNSGADQSNTGSSSASNTPPSSYQMTQADYNTCSNANTVQCSGNSCTCYLTNQNTKYVCTWLDPNIESGRCLLA